jgi:hypothetical protein
MVATNSVGICILSFKPVPRWAPATSARVRDTDKSVASTARVGSQASARSLGYSQSVPIAPEVSPYAAWHGPLFARTGRLLGEQRRTLPLPELETCLRSSRKFFPLTNEVRAHWCSSTACDSWFRASPIYSPGSTRRDDAPDQWEQRCREGNVNDGGSLNFCLQFGNIDLASAEFFKPTILVKPVPEPTSLAWRNWERHDAAQDHLFLPRSMASRMNCLACAASPHPCVFTHFPGSRSL